MLAKREPLERCGGVEGMETGPESTATSFNHKADGGHFSLAFAFTVDDMRPSGQDASQQYLCSVHHLSQFSAVLGLFVRLPLLGIGLLDVGL